jgi:hypothetical protein
VTSLCQQSRDLVKFITALNSNCLSKQMDGRFALVTQQFFIRLLKSLRDNVFDVWLRESLKLMKRVTQYSGHNQDCSRANLPLKRNGSPVSLTLSRLQRDGRTVCCCK